MKHFIKHNEATHAECGKLADEIDITLDIEKVECDDCIEAVSPSEEDIQEMMKVIKMTAYIAGIELDNKVEERLREKAFILKNLG